MLLSDVEKFNSGTKVMLPYLPSQATLLLTPGNLIWTLQDEAIQCNASDAWMRKSLILPGSLLADLAPISPLCHSPPDPWEITLNPNFLRRPVCYSCLENPSLSST